MYLGKPDEGRYHRIIECLEQQIIVLRDAKELYNEQISRIKTAPIDSSELKLLTDQQKAQIKILKEVNLRLNEEIDQKSK